MYDAFISYSQKRDKPVAQALRAVIQGIGKPWWQRRSLNIFLDATSLSAAPGLWPELERKLGASRYLILLASREAAASRWVDKEVAFFLAAEGRGIDRILIAKTDGELAWDPSAGDFAWNAATPLPPCLKGRFREEPLWVDLRAYRETPGDANKKNADFLGRALDLAATIRGVAKEDLYSEELRRQRRNLAWAYGAAGALLLLAGAAATLGFLANEQRKIADSERGIAEEQRKIAEEQRGIAEGERKTAEEQRDAARRSQSGLLAESSVRARQDGNAEKAALLALEALVGNDPAHPPPVVRAAEKALREALFDHRLRGVLRPGPGWRYASAHLNPDGSLLALTRETDGRTAASELWKVTPDGLAGSALPGEESADLVSIAFAPHGSLLAAVLADGSIRIRDVAKGAIVSQLGPFAGDRVEASFTADGASLIVNAARMEVFDVASGRRRYAIASRAERIAVPAAGARFAVILSAAECCRVEVYEAGAAKPVAGWPVEGTQSLSMSGDGRLVATSSYGGAKLWDAATGKLLRDLKAHQNRTFEALLSPGLPEPVAPEAETEVDAALRPGEFLVTEGDDGTSIWGAYGDVPVEQFAGSAAAWSAGNRLAVEVAGSTDKVKAVEIWELDFLVRLGYAAHRLARLDGLAGTAIASSFSADGKWLATLDGAGAVQVWQVGPPQRMASRIGPEAFVEHVALSGDGSRIATADTASSIVIYDGTSLEPLRTIALDGEIDWILSIAISPDGKRIAALTTQREANVFTVKAGERRPSVIRTFEAETGTRLSESPPIDIVPSRIEFAEADRLVLAEASLSVLAFDAATGNRVLIDTSALHAADPWPQERADLLSGFMAETGTDQNVVDQDYRSFDKLGAELLLGGADGQVHLWRAADRAWIGDLPVETFRIVEHVRGYRDGSRFLTIATERATPHLGIWRHLPDVPSLVHDGQATVRSCLAPKERQALQLPPEPPRWCIEMAKWPYATAEWKEWLARRDRGEAVPLP